MKTQHRITTKNIRSMKGKQPIVALTAYDYSSAKLVDQADVDMILIGDSLGMVIQGEETTIPVSLEHMIYHSRLVSNAVEHAIVIADMPFASYTESVEQGYRNAIRLIQEGRASGVKVEGGSNLVPLIKKLTESGVPVLGHLGLQPQMVLQYGGYLLQGDSEAGSDKMQKDALALQEAGVFGLVLEKIPARLAKKITESLNIPTIGIASGIDCDGQILVYHDLLGLQPEVHFKFVRRYANLGEEIIEAVRHYANDIRSKDFPSDKESY